MDTIRSKVKAITSEVPLENGTLEVIVNSGQLDRQGEILDIAGLDLSNYLESPVVAFGHKYDEPAIGKAISIFKDATTGDLKAKIKFAIEEYPFAKLIYDLYKGDYMRAFSIGFIPLQAEEDQNGNVVYTKSEMLEFSAVLVGADPRALATAKSMGGEEAVKAINGEIHLKDFKGIKEVESVEKVGRVLSKKNRSAVENAIGALQAVLDADSKEDKPAEKTEEIVTPVEIAEKAISGIKHIVNSGGRTDYTRVKSIAQILDRAAEEIIKRSNEEQGIIKITRRKK